MDVWDLSIVELAPLLRERKLSPVELTRTLLERSEQLNPRLNAYIRLLPDAALAAARTAEAEIAQGTYRGALHGIPVGVKDLFDVAGVPTTFGSTIMRDNTPVQDATVTARLKAAGAIVVGKQNLHEFAFGTTSENPHYGPVHNPWRLDCHPGGSSGGTASAIAGGLTPAAMGSDTGGSIRIPASMCGIVGIKPTYSRVSRAGALPLSWSLDHAGPLGRTTYDCAFMLQAIAGPDPRDPTASTEPVPDYTAELEAGVAGMKLGVPRQYFFDAIDPSVEGLVRDAIAELQGQGAFVDEVSMPHAEFAQLAGNAIMSSDGASWHGSWLRDRADEYGDDVLYRFRLGLVTRATDYLAGQKMRTLIQRDFAAAFTQVDAILTPTAPITSVPIGTTFDPLPPLNVVPRAVYSRLTVPANMAGIPAISVPCGFVDGLPVGLQVIGPSFEEARVLRVARAYERATRWHTLRPTLAT
jgi:aspartyl-tRNA(Asn)/glutamyl-tRNA(Gln) amidotransferase subunit A